METILGNFLRFEWLTNPDWISAIGTIGATLGAVGIAAYSIRIGQQNKKYEGLRYVFELLDDNGHRNARRRIVNLYGEDIEYRKEKILRLMGLDEDGIKRKEAILKESKEIVKADFEQIGSLLKNNEIPKDEFIKIYWHEVLKCWQVLNKDIQEIRNSLKSESYMQNFEELNKLAIEYAKRKKNVKDVTQLVHKDIIVYPQLNKYDYTTHPLQVSYRSDEILNSETLNNDTIYLIDENKHKITHSKLKIDYNVKLRLIIVSIIEKPKDKRCYLFFSTNIHDIYGIPLKEPQKTDHTV